MSLASHIVVQRLALATRGFKEAGEASMRVRAVLRRGALERGDGRAEAVLGKLVIFELGIELTEGSPGVAARVRRSLARVE